MRMDVGKMSYAALYSAMSHSRHAAKSIVRRGPNVYLELEVNDGPSSPPWDLEVAPITY